LRKCGSTKYAEQIISGRGGGETGVFVENRFGGKKETVNKRMSTRQKERHVHRGSGHRGKRINTRVGSPDLRRAQVRKRKGRIQRPLQRKGVQPSIDKKTGGRKHHWLDLLEKRRGKSEIIWEKITKEEEIASRCLGKKSEQEGGALGVLSM